MSLLCNDVTYYDIFSYIAEHLKWYFEDQHQPRMTGKIDIGEGSDVRLLKKVHKLLHSSVDNFIYMIIAVVSLTQ